MKVQGPIKVYCRVADDRFQIINVVVPPASRGQGYFRRFLMDLAEFTHLPIWMEDVWSTWLPSVLLTYGFKPLGRGYIHDRSTDLIEVLRPRMKGW